MGVAGNVALCYICMVAMLWLGGVGTGDTTLESVGEDALVPFVGISTNGSAIANQTFFGSSIDESAAGSTGNIFGFVSDLTRVWTGLKLLANILIAPISVLSQAGLPDELVIVFGAPVLLIAFIGILGFIKGKDL